MAKKPSTRSIMTAAEARLNAFAAELTTGCVPDQEFVLRAISAVTDRHGDRLRLRASRYYLAATTPEEVVADTIRRWSESLLTDGPAHQALSKRQEYPSLATWVDNACRHIYRREHRRLQRLETMYQEQVRRRVKPDDEATPEELLDQGAVLYWAVRKLKPALRNAMLVWLNWDPGFSAPNDETTYGNAQAAADYLGIKVHTYYQRVARGKARIVDLARGYGDLGDPQNAQALWQLTQDLPERPGFQSPFYRDLSPQGRYMMRIAEFASASFELRPLLRALIQADLLGDYQVGRHFMDLLLNSPELEQAPSRDRADCLISSAIYHDHCSARLESQGEFPRAEQLLLNGLQLLERVIPPGADPVEGEVTLGDKWTWAKLQLGILKRRLFQVRNRLNGHYAGPELQEAATQFHEVALVSRREDHRVSALHQLSHVMSLQRRLEEAEAMIDLCMKRWEVMIDREPDNADEYLIRKAYEHRALAKILAQRAEQARDVQGGAELAQQALDEFDLAGSLSARQANLRILNEIDRERRDLLKLAAARSYRLAVE